MDIRTALRRTLPGLLVIASATACAANPPRTPDAAWLRRTLAAQEAGLSRAYNHCHLHALRADLFAGTRIGLPDGRRIDPVLEARERICHRLHRQVVSGSLVVRAVGDDSALVTGTQRFCAVGNAPCHDPGSRFAQLWTLDRGHWRIGWMRRYPARPGS